jgi:hypothetical protein
MITVATSIQIAAPADKIWDVLVDLEKYPDWNPMFKTATGSVSVDQMLTISVRSQKLVMTPTILVATPGQELRWLGSIGGFPGMLDGNHYHIITDNGDGTCTFDHGEQLSGCLVPILDNLTGMFKNFEKGFLALNKSLKTRCEEESPSNKYASTRRSSKLSKRRSVKSSSTKNE